MRKLSTSNYAFNNARIYPMNPQATLASNLDIQQGRIRSLPQETLDRGAFAANTDHIDLDGRTVLPGLCDAHIHIEKYALMLDQVDCETASLSECLSRVETRCRDTEPGKWVLGHGWNQNDWGGYGTLQELDAISIGYPVYLTAKSLHVGWANSKAVSYTHLTLPTTPYV